jgi:hypothetical protein
MQGVQRCNVQSRHDHVNGVSPHYLEVVQHEWDQETLLFAIDTRAGMEGTEDDESKGEQDAIHSSSPSLSASCCLLSSLLSIVKG